MAGLRVLVVGASIAGPNTAYWLAKAGAHVTVIERFPELRKGGQNIDVRTVGVTVMSKIPGMTEAVMDKRVPMDGFTWVDTAGQPYATMKATGDPDQQSLISEFEIYRGDLSKIIYDLTAENDNVEYIFNEQVASLHQTPSESDAPVTVEFLNGTPTAEFDLVVACDGSTSRTRALGFDCSVRDHVKPLGCWAGYFSIKEELVPSGTLIGHAYNAPGGRFIGTGSDPTGGNRGVVLTMYPESDSPGLAAFREAQKLGDDALKVYLNQHYRGAGWKVDQLLDALENPKDFYASELVQVKMPALSKGRCVLVGDAGYAAGFGGTGTSLAICGGYVLAGELLRNKGNIRAGLEAYEGRMKPIIDDMQQVPWGVASFLAPQTSWGLAVRNVVLKVVCFLMQFGKWFNWVSGLFSPAFGKDKYGLPDYDWVA